MQIQWRWPGCYGEDHFIVMFRGLHIEMNALKMLGDLFDSSEWTGALTQANITLHTGIVGVLGLWKCWRMCASSYLP